MKHASQGAVQDDGCMGKLSPSSVIDEAPTMTASRIRLASLPCSSPSDLSKGVDPAPLVYTHTDQVHW